MKKIWILTTLLVGGLLLTGCINEDVKQDNTILTWGFTPVPRVDKENQQDSKQPEIPEVFSNIDLSKIDIRSINLQELKPEELLYLRENIDYSKLSDEDKMYLMIWHDPYDYVEDDGYHIITSHLISDECAYNSDEYGIRMNLDKWNDCKISYQEIEDKNWRYCHERDKDWEKLWIDMPDPMLWIYETTSYKMKEFIQFYD